MAKRPTQPTTKEWSAEVFTYLFHQANFMHDNSAQRRRIMLLLLKAPDEVKALVGDLLIEEEKANGQ
jgi:hypothetical protein